MSYSYETSGTCSRIIHFDLEGNVVHNVRFEGGCHGNLQAVARLVEGLTVDEVQERCRGINCCGKGTSCPDQLARGVAKAWEKAQG